MSETPSQGTIVKMGATASPTTVIGKITSFDGPGGAATVIDASNLASVAKEKMMGLPDEGQFKFDLNFDQSDTGQAALQAARSGMTKQYFEIDFAGGGSHKASFQGYVTEFAIKGAVDALVSATVSVEITGAVTWA